jgi:hypothetical protein
MIENMTSRSPRRLPILDSTYLYPSIANQKPRMLTTAKIRRYNQDELNDGMCWISPIPTEAIKLVTAITTQLNHVTYRGEYDPVSFFDEDNSTPLATPFKSAMDAARSEKTTKENEKVIYSPMQAKTNAIIFIFVAFSP